MLLSTERKWGGGGGRGGSCLLDEFKKKSSTPAVQSACHVVGEGGWESGCSHSCSDRCSCTLRSKILDPPMLQDDKY